jgi:hypothetical protein
VRGVEGVGQGHRRQDGDKAAGQQSLCPRSERPAGGGDSHHARLRFLFVSSSWNGGGQGRRDNQLAMAGCQGAKSLERQAALQLHRLWPRQDKWAAA